MFWSSRCFRKQSTWAVCEHSLELSFSQGKTFSYCVFASNGPSVYWRIRSGQQWCIDVSDFVWLIWWKWVCKVKHHCANLLRFFCLCKILKDLYTHPRIAQPLHSKGRARVFSISRVPQVLFAPESDQTEEGEKNSEFKALPWSLRLWEWGFFIFPPRFFVWKQQLLPYLMCLHVYICQAKNWTKSQNMYSMATFGEEFIFAVSFSQNTSTCFICDFRFFRYFSTSVPQQSMMYIVGAWDNFQFKIQILRVKNPRNNFYKFGHTERVQSSMSPWLEDFHKNLVQLWAIQDVS